MRLFVFADVQGNRWAVEALLQRAKRLADVELVCLGSAVGAGPDPAGTVELLRKRGALLVRGARDEAALGRAPAPALRDEGAANARRLAPADLAYLRAAPPSRRIATPRGTALLTSDPREVPAVGSLVLQPHDGAPAPDTGRVRLAPPDARTGEAEWALLDLGTGAVTRHVVAWDADAFLRAQTPGAQARTRHS